jgi:hypothetical protein
MTLKLTAEERDFILAKVANFKAEAPEELRWQLKYVQTHQALPLFLGWTETLGIRADGALVRWSTEGDWPGVREFDDRTWINIALVEGAKTYPQLQRLVPRRPPSATTCETCCGSGTIRGPLGQVTEIICTCGGLGWIPVTGAG